MFPQWAYLFIKLLNYLLFRMSQLKLFDLILCKFNSKKLGNRVQEVFYLRKKEVHRQV